MSTKDNVSAGQSGDRVPVYDSYARLSRVPETGELEKIETQHDDNMHVIKRLGGTLGERLSDGLSAWKRGVRRKDWERLLARLESGVSDGVVVWHTDRLFRQPKDLEKLIELGESGYLVASAHGARNLADPDDRYFLRIEVAHAARSSDDTQRRTKRRFAAKRDQGIPHYGPRSFGFQGPDRLADKDPKTGKRPDVPAALVEREREAIRDGARLLTGGMPQDKVAQEWNAAGLRTTLGNEFTGLGVRDVMLRPRNAGYIEHEGEIVGRIRDHDPILKESEYVRLQALFAGRRRGRVPGNQYVGSGVLTCSCGRPMSGRPHNGTYPDGEKRRQYFCAKNRRGCGKVAIDMRATDQELCEFVVQRLSDPRFADAIATARNTVTDRLERVRKEITECETLQRALSDRLGRRELTLDAFDAANKPLAEDLERLNDERDKLEQGTGDGPVTVQSAEQIRQQWTAAPVSDKRVMLKSALRGGLHIVVKPASKTGKRAFDRNRLAIGPRENVRSDNGASPNRLPVTTLQPVEGTQPMSPTDPDGDSAERAAADHAAKGVPDAVTKKFTENIVTAIEDYETATRAAQQKQQKAWQEHKSRDEMGG